MVNHMEISSQSARRAGFSEPDAVMEFGLVIPYGIKKPAEEDKFPKQAVERERFFTVAASGASRTVRPSLSPLIS
jgi:hypothetical protein